MELRQLTDGVTVAGQIDPTEIPLLAQKGFRTIICNRPDGEAADQPSFAEVEKAAAAHGMTVFYIPVAGSAIGETDVEAFGQALASSPQPVLAYCRSGTRSAVLWSLSQAGKLPIEDILLRAMRAGYDLSAMEPRLEAMQRR